jgi:hypothetical protein
VYAPAVTTSAYSEELVTTFNVPLTDFVHFGSGVSLYVIAAAALSPASR